VSPLLWVGIALAALVLVLLIVAVAKYPSDGSF
jgi:hypothetical protein